MNSVTNESFRILSNGMNDPIYEEREVIAGMIASSGDGEITDRYLDELQADDFLYYQHQLVFEAIAALRRDGLPVDEITLENELIRRDTLQQVGGMAYIIEILTSTVVHGNWRGVVHLVKSHHKRRQTLELASKIAQAAIADNRTDTEQALTQAQRLIAPARTSRRRTYVNSDDLNKLPPIQWLIPGKVPDRALTAIFGRSGEGKSFYALRLAYEIGQRFNVLYVAAEGQAGYAQRVEAGKVMNRVQSFGKVRFCLGTVSLMDKQDLAAFIEENRDYAPRLIIVDTLARSMPGGDENSTRDMTLYIDACNQLMDEFACATILVHHIGKSGFVERGSTALRASCDMMIRISTEDDTTLVECSKTKDQEPFPTEYMKLVQVDLPIGTGAWLMPGERVVQDDHRITGTQQTILDMLAMEIHSEGCSPGEIEAYTGITHGSTTRALNTLLKRGLIAKVRAGIYTLTAQAIAQIAQTDLNTPQTDPDRSVSGSDRPDRADRIEKTGVVNENVVRSDRSTRSERKTPDLDSQQTDLDTDLTDLNSYQTDLNSHPATRPGRPEQLVLIQPPTRYE